MRYKFMRYREWVNERKGGMSNKKNINKFGREKKSIQIRHDIGKH